MFLDPLLIAELALLGISTGFLAGLLGIGGGMIMVPFLSYFLGTRGVAPDLAVKMAIASSMATIMFTSISSVRAHHKRGAVRWDLVRTLAPGIVAGSLVGSLGVFALVYALVSALERSWIGLSMDVVRTDETAAATFGLHIARWKVIAFTTGNFFAGIAGALYGLVSGFVAPNNFTFADSLLMLSIVILGGLGNIVGLLPAAMIVLVLPEKLQFIQEYRFLLFAALVIVILLFRPQGLLPRTTRIFFRGESSR